MDGKMLNTVINIIAIMCVVLFIALITATILHIFNWLTLKPEVWDCVKEILLGNIVTTCIAAFGKYLNQDDTKSLGEPQKNHPLKKYHKIIWCLIPTNAGISLWELIKNYSMIKNYFSTCNFSSLPTLSFFISICMAFAFFAIFEFLYFCYKNTTVEQELLFFTRNIFMVGFLSFISAFILFFWKYSWIASLTIFFIISAAFVTYIFWVKLYVKLKNKGFARENK